MTTNTTVAVRDETPNSPSITIAQYQSDFAMVLPANFKPETFVRLAQGALRQNRKLMEAAQANPASLLVALLEAARLGHEPATDDYYLRPLGGKNGPSVQGIEGYKGVIKRMFNSGTVDSVVAEAVHQKDHFDWKPGLMRVPEHEPDWFGDRGVCIGAYAYAIFKGGAVSKVVVVGSKRIKRAMSASDGADSSFSPWKRDYEKMVIKTALHDLEPYVPKSAEMQRLDSDARAAALQVVQDHPELEAAVHNEGVYDSGDDRMPRRVTAAEIINAETGEITEAPPQSPAPRTAAAEAIVEVDGWPPVPEIKP